MRRYYWVAPAVTVGLLSLCGCDSGASGTQDSASGGAQEKTMAPDKKESDPAMTELDAFIAQAKIDKTAPNWKTQVQKPPKLKFDPAAKYFINMETNKGKIKIRLMPDVAPMHVSSFMYLTRIGFYDGITFHRVIPGFMAQGGDPLGNGRGGPAYKFDGEYDLSKVKHDRPHLLSMANAGPGTDGSQFFLTFVPTPHLDGKHTIFGEIVEGQDTMGALQKCGSQSGATTEKLLMEKVTVEVTK